MLGIIAMFLGSDLTALGVFLAMANMPLYTYILGESLAPTKIPDSYYEQTKITNSNYRIPLRNQPDDSELG